MSVGTVIVKKLFGLVWSLLGVFRKLLCFLNIKRGRKNSGTILPLHGDPVANSIPQSVPSNEEVELESWDNWGEGDGAVSGGQTGAQSRRPAYPNTMPVLLSKKAEPEPEPDIDFFTDMKPRIKRTSKVLIKGKEIDAASSGISTRLAMTNDVHLAPIEASGGLDSWQDVGASEANGWGEEATEDLSWQAESAIRDKKRLERERRVAEHQKRKQEKEMTRGVPGKGGQFSAVKLS